MSTSLKGRRVKVFLKYPVVEPGKLTDRIEGICVMDGRSEIKIYNSDEHVLFTIQKRNIVLIKTEAHENEVELSYD